MKRFAVIVAILAPVIAIGTSFGLLASASMSDRVDLAVTLVSAIIQLASAYLFLYAVQSFKPALRKSYILIVIGMVLLVFVQVGLPVATIFHLYDFWPLPMLVLIAYFFSGMVMYIGIRKYALLVGARDVGTRWSLVIGLVAILAVLLTLIFREAPLPQLIASSLAFNIAAVIVARRIRQQLGSTYTDAINKLTLSLVAVIIFDVHTVVAQAISPDANGWYFMYGIHYWPQVLWAVTSLIAGQAFFRTIYHPQAIQENANFLDSIMYTAALASNTRAIDPILDQLRVITASRTPENFTAQDRRMLLAIYRQLEDYLVTSDPMRTYSRQELRSHLTYDFQSALKAPTK